MIDVFLGPILFYFAKLMEIIVLYWIDNVVSTSKYYSQGFANIINMNQKSKNTLIILLLLESPGSFWIYL